jgi:N-acetylglutamate synthase-like GNAT family acetyltransferase
MDWRIRPATADQAAAIQQLVRSSGINPTSLDWRRFLIAINDEEALVGCGQIKPHADGSQELASIAVQPNWRGRGVARALIEALLKQQDGDLYLMCQSSLGLLYEKFGFATIGEDQMPTYFRRISKLAGVLAAVRSQGESLVIMRRSG